MSGAALLGVAAGLGVKPHALGHALALSEDGDHAGALRWAATGEQGARNVTEYAVRAARSSGLTWQEVGAALGMSKQAAWERFRHVELTR